MRNRKFVRLIAIVLVLLLIGPTIGGIILRAFAADNVADLQKQLDDLMRQQRELEKKIQTSQSSKKTEVQRKTELEREINTLTKRIGQLDTAMQTLDQQIGEKQKESDRITLQLNHQTEQYLSRMRETYERGQVSFLDVLFGSASLREFVARLDYTAEVAMYDETLIKDMKRNLQSVKDAKKTIELDLAQQQAARAEISQIRVAIQAKTNEVNKNIKEIDQDLTKQKQMLAAAEKEQKKVDAELKKELQKRNKGTYVGGDMLWPTPGYTKISDEYGMRTHPITKQRKMHTGVDIAAKGGTKIISVNSGTVVKTDYNSAWGNYILIDHGGGISTFYAHMQSTALVSAGESVTRGQKIGLVGTTGYSTGNHLHFEVKLDGDSVNPLNYVTPA